MSFFKFRDRNNQNLEGAHNGAINLGKSDVAGSSRGSYNRWIRTAQKEEELVLPTENIKLMF